MSADYPQSLMRSPDYGQIQPGAAFTLARYRLILQVERKSTREENKVFQVRDC
ncbi:hypothetical protein FB99_46730 (plasmid) [Pantoea agglomerans]|nr:hypothetical protein FB99_46730 [Pantoea agglomerans]